ncbi:hypothetical protein Pmani_014596 [Petrolisthes manimaculis]|uniref:DDE Tnp4 domain-containing protein n=1 Tax=Petrolisthes manimaculis TaxID=1843537 RepID=A0AAE1PW58_9EUCA|nr:hypothetical protein Pmani_014596 [Petrolisthes manimaculis]
MDMGSEEWASVVEAPTVCYETHKYLEQRESKRRKEWVRPWLAESRRSLEFQYRISHSLISSIIPEVCDALYAVLRDTYMKLPTSSSEWQEVASTFSTAWNFPNCLGALDGKRFLVIKPSNSGSEYFDYKSHNSVIMLALVDADYKFLYVDVGGQGRASDAGVWDRCNLRKYLEENKLKVPAVVLHNFLRVNCKAHLPTEMMRREDIANGVIIPSRLSEVGGFERLQAVGRGHSDDAKAV